MPIPDSRSMTKHDLLELHNLTSFLSRPHSVPRRHFSCSSVHSKSKKPADGVGQLATCYPPIALVMCDQLLHNHMCMWLKRCSFDWCRWLVASLCSLSCTISELSLFFACFAQAFLTSSVGSEKYSSARTEKWPHKCA